MRFNAYIIVLFLAISLHAYGESRPHIDNSTLKKLRDKQSVELSGWVVVLGAHQSNSASELTEKSGYKKAHLIAYKYLTNSFFEITGIPDRVNSKTEMELTDTYLRLVGDSFNFEGVETLRRFQTPEYGYEVVLGVKKRKQLINNIAFSEVVSALERAFNVGRRDFSLLLYLELCHPKYREKVIDELSIKLGNMHGWNASAVLVGGSLSDIPNYWLSDPDNISNYDELSLRTLIGLSQDRPYERNLCVQMSIHLHKNGYFIAANIYSNRAGRLAENDWSEADIDIEKLKSVANESGNSIHLLHKYLFSTCGNLPLCSSNKESAKYNKGNSIFFSSQPNILNALSEYLEAFNECPSSDCCNMIGRCLNLLGHPDAAIPFLRQALKWNSQHPTARANYGHSLLLTKRMSMGVEQANIVLSNSTSSSWAKTMIKRELDSALDR